MLDPRVEAYGAVRDANRRVIEFSFEHMMVVSSGPARACVCPASQLTVHVHAVDDYTYEQAHYQGLPHTFTDNQMPEGWGGEDGARAARVFLSFLKEIMKYLRSGLRTNVSTRLTSGDMICLMTLFDLLIAAHPCSTREWQST